MGWLAIAEPCTPELVAEMTVITKQLVANEKFPDMLLEAGAVHLRRHRRRLEELTGVSRWAAGLSPAQVAALAARPLRSPDLSALLRCCAKHGVGLKYLG